MVSFSQFLWPFGRILAASSGQKSRRIRHDEQTHVADFVEPFAGFGIVTFKASDQRRTPSAASKTFRYPSLTTITIRQSNATAFVLIRAPGFCLEAPAKADGRFESLRDSIHASERGKVIRRRVVD
jgi:hypothetical protein